MRAEAHDGAASPLEPESARRPREHLRTTPLFAPLLPLLLTGATVACDGEPRPVEPAAAAVAGGAKPADASAERDTASEGGPVGAGTTGDETGVVAPPERVMDLRVSGATDTSVTLSFTEVDDGTGNPALYHVRYTPTAENRTWDAASVASGGCSDPVRGSEIGATLSCSVAGLDAGADYTFGLVAFRRDGDGERVYGEISNTPDGRTEAAGPLPSGGDLWIDPADLAELPIWGPAWDRVFTDAARDPGPADISDQDSNHDVYTLAGALVCVRTGEYCAKARQGVVDAIGTEEGTRWLAVGRNLGSYIIAADLLDLRADGTPGSAGTRVEEWIEGWLTKRLRDNNTTTLREFGPFHGSANAAAQEGFAYAAVAAYLQDDWALERAWDAFRTYACDPSAPDRENIYLDKSVADGWAHDDLNPCAVNPAGTAKMVPLGLGLPGAGDIFRIDGALTGDMRRGGVYQWPPGYTSYPWVGLEGFVPAAVVLHRAGYPAFEVADRAVLRTHDYLWFLRTGTGEERWFDGIRAREIVHIVNVVYGTSFPVNRVTGGGRTVGYTDWTHSEW